VARSQRDIGWVLRNDGEPDQRYVMPQVLNFDGSRDRRFDLFQQPEFGPTQLLREGRSQYYNGINAPHAPGKVYFCCISSFIVRINYRCVSTANYAGFRTSHSSIFWHVERLESTAGRTWARRRRQSCFTDASGGQPRHGCTRSFRSSG
jgi:hypothetical protein